MVRTGVVAASVALLMPLAASVARAEPTRKVAIETDPPGAKVYLNQKEDGVKCTTPCTIDAPLGETPLIIELENYAPSITMLDVAKGRGALKQSIKLVATGGGIDAKAWPGGGKATVKVDDEDKGTAPLKIPVDPGKHHVAYFVDGKQVYEESVQVDAGADYYELTPTAPESVPSPPPKDDSGNPLDADPNADLHKAAPEEPHARTVTASLVYDVGFRQFSYTNPQTPNLRSETEGGQMLAGPLIEFYPTALVAPGKLPNLALLLRAEFGFHDNTVAMGNGIMNPTTTFWQSIEVSARNRWLIGDTAAIDATAGYVQDRLQFNGNDSDIALVPDADYSSVKIGARGALLLGDVEPFAEVENRVVLSSGNLGARFDHSSTNGLHAELGFVVHHGALIGKLEGQLTRYSSTFTTTTASPMYKADGGTDMVELIELSAGYTY